DLLVLPAALVGRVVRGRDGSADEAEAEADAAEAKAMAVAEAMRGRGGERGDADDGGGGDGENGAADHGGLSPGCGVMGITSCTSVAPRPRQVQSLAEGMLFSGKCSISRRDPLFFTPIQR